VAPASTETTKEFIVIAHRGASGYLPEHTLEGAAAAHAMGADYVEQDVLLTRDDRLIVLHDLYLDAVTDVAERFPDRRRADGRHYAIDFSLEEIRSLRAHERTGPDGAPALPGRFPPDSPIFRVPTLEGAVELKIPPNSSGGRTLRLKGKGLPGKGRANGDLYVTLRIVLPEKPDPDLEALMTAWREGKPYDPRA